MKYDHERGVSLPLLPDLVGRLASIRAEDVAYVDGERSLSWAEVDDRRLALVLRQGMLML